MSRLAKVRPIILVASFALVGAGRSQKWSRRKSAFEGIGIRRRLSLPAVAIAVALLWSGAFASSASAAQVTDTGSDFDVSSSGGGIVNNNSGPAQTFTAVRCGSLVGVSLGLERVNAPSDLTVRIYEAVATTVLVPGWIPTGPALSTTTVTNVSGVAPFGTKAFFNVALSTTVPVAAGAQYAIVVSSTASGADYYQWDSGMAATGANVAFFGVTTPGQWESRMGDYAFKTTTDEGPCPNQGSNTVDLAAMRTLSLDSTSGTCTSTSSTARDGAWIGLPAVVDCALQGRTLLGWSTSLNFPIAIAQRQIAQHWGLYDGSIDGARMIFVPAGGHVLISGENTLHAVWTPAA